jgi:hypothetical protein
MPETDDGRMTTATFTPAPAQAVGATATGPAASHTSSDAHHSASHPVGSALRAVRVFAAAVVSVVILGEYSS